MKLNHIPTASQGKAKNVWYSRIGLYTKEGYVRALWQDLQRLVRLVANLVRLSAGGHSLLISFCTHVQVLPHAGGVQPKCVSKNVITSFSLAR